MPNDTHLKVAESAHERGREMVLNNLLKAAEPFKRVLAINHPWLNNSDDRPLRDFIPGVWPTWGEYKLLMTAISMIDEARLAAAPSPTSYSDDHVG